MKTMGVHNKLPEIGFGTYKVFEKEVIKNALRSGYRLIDTASNYDNEEIIGRALKEADVLKTEITVQSKLRYSKMGYDNALFSFEETLKKLQVEVLDTYLIHWPAASPQYEEWEKVNYNTWRAFERLYEEKRVKVIGVCNFMEKHMNALVRECKIMPIVNQIEVHPGFNQRNAVDCCKEKNIIVQAWQPLGKGEVLNNAVLASIAKEYNKSIAQICIKWLLQHGISPIVKSNHLERMKENRMVYDFELSEEHMKSINKLPFCGGEGVCVK